LKASLLKRLACVDNTCILQPAHGEELVEELSKCFAKKDPIIETRRKLLMCHELPLAHSIRGEGVPLVESGGGVPVECSVGSEDVLGGWCIVVIDGETLCQDVANISAASPEQ
jgi:hypothetical protein